MNKNADSGIKYLILDINTPISQYIYLITENYSDFCDSVRDLLDNKVMLQTSILGKLLACALALNDRTLSEYILHSCKLPEVLRACEILDSRRLLTQLTKRKEKLKNTSKINTIDTTMKTLLEYGTTTCPIVFSLTKSKTKMIKKYWLSKIPVDKLEFYALMYKLDYWKQLADILHLKNTDFQLDWFLQYVYGNDAPAGTCVNECKNLTKENSFGLISKYKPDYNYLRQLSTIFDHRAYSVICTYTELDVLLWWLNEFVNYEEALSIVSNRLSENELLTNLPYGVIIDKIFMLRSFGLVGNRKKIYDKLLIIAERLLKQYSLKLTKCVVFGDASGSMEVAIKTSSIITSILSVLCGAELNIFRATNSIINDVPKTIGDVIKFNETCRACDGTSPASSLARYYLSKTPVNTIIIVTDEEENGQSNGLRFFEMFCRYCETIKAVPNLIFVSFLRQGEKGQMFPRLKEKFGEHVHQFIFDRNKPDLTKLDSILSKLSVFQQYHEGHESN